LNPGAAQATRHCQVCGGALETGLRPWHFVCTDCAFECSDLTPSINRDDGAVAKEELYDSLAPLRHRNFVLLCDQLARLTSLQGKQLLEVGCAYGWFLDVAQQRGLACQGIEADAAWAATTVKRGHQVIQGFFPECLDPAGMGARKYDLIVFNDVFEHLPDLNQAMAACRAHLADDGLLVINLPAATGVLYRISKLLSRLGRPASFERMWQMGFPSPHLAYFSARTLPRLADKHGLRLHHSFSLPSLAYSGLWQRIDRDQRMPLWKKSGTFLVLAMLIPALALLPQDIEVHVFRPAS
jgi:SAM-dependent methyltransferase